MKKVLLGIIIGIIALAAFLYFGGGRYLRVFGAKTEEAGEKLEKYEKEMKKEAEVIKESAKEAGETIKEKAGDAKEAVKDTAEGAREAVSKAKEKAKGWTK
ncbi:MAG: hypothetical protein HYV24_03010 [Deltaproteobacteria bacterium]|nr:hypothetical protein [Deltaproteobacteria bacterium]